MSAPGHEGRAATLVAVMTAAWAGVLFAAFRPGLMSIDSIVQYGQGTAWAFSNQHPPLGTAVFGLSGALFGSPAGVLALQLALVGGGFAVLALAAARRHAAAAVALTALYLAAPSTWALAVILWKDVLFAGALVVACAALARRRTAAALALLVVASLLRHDAVFAAAPLAVGAAWTSPWLRAPVRRGLVCAAALVAMAVGPGAVDRLAHARDVWPVGQLFVYDLAGIYVRHPDALAASSLARDVSVADLQRAYTPLTGGPLLFPKRGEGGVPFSSLAGRRGLAAEWLRAILRYPAAYAAHRWSVFEAQLGLEPGPAFAPYHERIDRNSWGFHLTPGALQAALVRVRDAARDGPLFRGWAWLCACAVAGVVAALRARRDAVPLWIAASGLCYALVHLVISVSSEFRYVYWTALCPFVAAAAALAFRSTAHCDSPPTISTRRSAK